MPPHDDAPTPEPSPEVTPAAEPPGSRAGIEAASRTITSKAFRATVAAALLAGAAAWPICEAFHEYFQPSEEAASQPYDFRQLNKEEAQTNSWNGAIVFGALGGFVGLAMGLAGGITAGTPRRALAAGVVGLVLGGVAGSLPPFAIMPWHWMHKDDDPATLDLTRSLILHAGLYCALGLAAGLAYGLGRFGGNPRALFESTLGGLVGVAIGTLVAEISGALLFPQGRTADPIAAAAPARLLTLLCISGFVALGILLALRPRTPKEPKPTATA